jgi:hypothetical protein
MLCDRCNNQSKNLTTMTVYTCDITTSPTDAAGETTTSIASERINDTGANFVSSEDFVDAGVQVIDGRTGDRKSVYSSDDLDPSDIVRVEGIPMTVAQAKAAGYSFDADEPILLESADGAKLSDNEEAVQVLDLREEGVATDAEVVAIDNVANAVEMHTGLDREATIELGKDILLGEISQGDEVWTGLQNKGISQDAAIASVHQVVQVGQAAAMRELGQAEYQELSGLAGNSAAIRNLVIDHGINRMTGKSKGVTWKHVLTLARQFARA